MEGRESEQLQSDEMDRKTRQEGRQKVQDKDIGSDKDLEAHSHQKALLSMGGWTSLKAS